jgi:hypothetical protein
LEGRPGDEDGLPAWLSDLRTKRYYQKALDTGTSKTVKCRIELNWMISTPSRQRVRTSTARLVRLYVFFLTQGIISGLLGLFALTSPKTAARISDGSARA